ncbi:MAG: MarR family winged helix-turn-helix transcriptional regulator [Bacillaceae bacterium]
MDNKIALLNQYWTDIYFHLHYPHKEKISHQAIRILQLIEKQTNIGIAQVASHLHISHNTASEHIKRLIEKKYILKKRNDIDERKVILCLTPLGKEVLHQHTRLDEEKLNHLFSQLSEDEKQLIEQAFKLLSEGAKRCI